MTAKEAAKQSAAWLKRYRWAAGFVGIGALIALVGSSYDELPDSTTMLGAGSAVWGMIVWISEHYTKKTSSATADEVFERLWRHLGSVQLQSNEASALAMAMQQELAEHKKETADWLNDHDDKLHQLGAVAAELKPGWKWAHGS